MLDTVLFHLKPHGPVFGQPEVLGVFYCGISRLLEYWPFRRVNARLKRQQYEVSYACRHIMILKTSMIIFDRTDQINILPFLSRLVEEGSLEHISEAQAYVRIPCF